MRILVTGGSGYVGGFTARRLLRADHEVVCVDDLSQGHRASLPPDVLRVGEIQDRAFVTGLLREREIEAVVHFAGSTSVGESVRDPALYYRNNVAHSLALFESMRDAGTDRIVFSSTCAVYGESAESPLHERLPAQPSSPYAATKWAVEQMIDAFAHAHGWRYAALRYFNAAGADASGAHGEDHTPETHLIPLAIAAALGTRPKLQVFGTGYPTRDGTCIRDYVHVEDLADAHALALEYTGSREGVGGEAFNLGTGRGTTVFEVLGAVERALERPVPHEVAPVRPGDVAALVADPAHSRAGLGWKPKFSEVEPIVSSAAVWHRDHPDGYPK